MAIIIMSGKWVDQINIYIKKKNALKHIKLLFLRIVPFNSLFTYKSLEMEEEEQILCIQDLIDVTWTWLNTTSYMSQECDLKDATGMGLNGCLMDWY